MLIWVCALHCEAKPIIDFYRLKKSHDDNAFDIYIGDQMLCVISGIGKVASASACGWVAARFEAGTPIAWINLGIGGAANRELGEACLINQIIDADSDARYYPAPLKTTGLTQATCLTLSHSSDDYHPEFLFDQEASGFIYSALRFSTCELTQCVKVISDNSRSKTGKNRQEVSDLIHQQINHLDHLATHLQTVLDELEIHSIPVSFWQDTLDSTHFSQTQKKRLRNLLSYLISRQHSPENLSALMSADNSAAKIIKSLEALVHSDSSNL